MRPTEADVKNRPVPADVSGVVIEPPTLQHDIGRRGGARQRAPRGCGRAGPEGDTDVEAAGHVVPTSQGIELRVTLRLVEPLITGPSHLADPGTRTLRSDRGAVWLIESRTILFANRIVC